MANKELQQYYRSGHWQALKMFILDRDGGRCVLCNRKAVQVHHRSYKHIEKFEEESRDCVALCKRCHHVFHKNARITRVNPEISDFEWDEATGGYWKK